LLLPKEGEVDEEVIDGQQKQFFLEDKDDTDELKDISAVREEGRLKEIPAFSSPMRSSESKSKFMANKNKTPELFKQLSRLSEESESERHGSNKQSALFVVPCNEYSAREEDVPTMGRGELRERKGNEERKRSPAKQPL